MPTYKIMRMYQQADEPSHVVATGLTLEEAQAHCRDPETSSRTCTDSEGVQRTKVRGPWFDCCTKEDDDEEA